ncbi:MAG: hypothetical protein M1391_02755 [Bacteroidetes bacterium]|nr:hypothetical protein [Bacteroidota bacterium]
MGDACDASLRKNILLTEVETFRERLGDTLGDACDASLRKNVLLIETGHPAKSGQVIPSLRKK